MYKIIAIMGEAGSGKDSVMQGVLKELPELHEIISCTTRPIREGEAEGVNYFYMTPEAFGDKVLHNEMLECAVFNDWFYGTSYESLRSDAINIGVFNPTGVESLLERPDIETSIYWITASDKQRLLRQLNREEHPDVNEIVRRFGADKHDFADIDFAPRVLENEKQEDFDKCVQAIAADVKHLFTLGQNN